MSRRALAPVEVPTISVRENWGQRPAADRACSPLPPISRVDEVLARSGRIDQPSVKASSTDVAELQQADQFGAVEHDAEKHHCGSSSTITTNDRREGGEDSNSGCRTATSKQS